MSLKSVVLYTADPWESAMPYLRVHAPARLGGIQVIQGNVGDEIYLDKISEADVVIIQRDFPRFPAYDEVIIRARAEKKLVLYEVDDLILEVPDWHVSHPAFVDVLFRILRGVVEADAVITSTPLLQEYYSTINPDTRVFPNLLDDTLWKLKPPRSINDMPQKPTIIGYMGGRSHLPDLEMIKPVIKKVIEEYGANVEFNFWGVKPPAELLDLLNVKWIQLDTRNYVEFATYFAKQDCDIFIAPLLDNYFNQCKSHIKFLEYSALGVPGIYSNLEPYNSIVKNGENGFLAGNLMEWETRLQELIESPGLRFELGTKAQETAMRDWSLSRNYSDWISTCEEGAFSPNHTQPDRADLIQTFLRISTQSDSYQAQIARRLEELSVMIQEKDQLLQGSEDKFLQISHDLERQKQASMAGESELASTRLELEKLKLDYAGITSQLNSARQELETLEQDYDGVESQLISTRQDLDEAKHNYAITEQKLNSAREELKNSEQKYEHETQALLLQLQNSEEKVANIYKSRTWKVGSKLSKIYLYLTGKNRKLSP